MQKKVRFLGLDVHAETIAVAVAEQDGEVRSLGVIPNRAESVRKLIRRLRSEAVTKFIWRGCLRVVGFDAQLGAVGKIGGVEAR